LPDDGSRGLRAEGRSCRTDRMATNRVSNNLMANKAVDQSNPSERAPKQTRPGSNLRHRILGHLPLPKRRSTRCKNLAKRKTEFAWESAHDTKIGKFWDRVKSDERGGVCAHCNAGESMEHVFSNAVRRPEITNTIPCQRTMEQKVKPRSHQTTAFSWAAICRTSTESMTTPKNASQG